MSIVSPWFVLLALAAAFLARRQAAIRAHVLTVASLVFFVGVMPTPGGALAVLGLAATGFLLVRAVTRWKSGLLLAAGVALILTEFLLARHFLPYRTWFPGLDAPETLGLSYVMFRVIHLMVDARDGELPDRLSVRDYVCYLFFYLSFLAGPIQRYQEFASELSGSSRRPDDPGPVTGVPLVILGYFRFAVVAAVFFLGFELALQAAFTEGSGLVRAVGFAATCLGFAGYLYFSFSGYTDVMRGFGMLAGFHLPANFDRPFASQDFLGFWARWHITLSDWFKIYVFNPAVKELISATGRPKLAPYLAAIGYFLTFFLMGLWHGTSVRFILYGLCLAAGVSANKLFQTWLTARLGKARYTALAKAPFYVAAARALALTYFVLALAFFWVPPAEVDGAASILIEAAIGAGLVLLLIFLLALAADRANSERLQPVRRRLEAWRPRPAFVTAAALAAVLLVLAAYPEAVPPLLYQFF